LRNRNFSFVLSGNKIERIVTRADINKPPVRIYLFGIISLFEMHLNFWINYYYPDSNWELLISKKRLEEAKELYKTKKMNNQDLSLLEYLQYCDKRDILKKSEGFLEKFDISKKQFYTFVKHVENIRNELAHSQRSIISNFLKLLII